MFTKRAIVKGLLAASLVAVFSAQPLVSQAESITSAPRIVNGTQVKANSSDYPWMVSLVYSDAPNAYFGAFCGGALIAPDLVLTAAHCVDEAVSSELEVVIGKADLLAASSGDRQDVEEIIVHEDWSTDTSANDIALLRVDPTPNLTTPVLPILKNYSSIKGGTSLTAIGWGSTHPDGNQLDHYPAILRTGKIKLAADLGAQCGLWGGYFDPATMICATGGRAGKIIDTCFGDSGGPLLVKQGRSWATVGIVSWGESPCATDLNYPGVYTRLQNYLNWIGQYTESVESMSPLQGTPGTLITLEGYFAGGVDAVYFGDFEAEIVDVSDSQIQVIAPLGPKIAKPRVELTSGRVSQGLQDFSFVYPRSKVTSFTTSAPVGGEVTINGTNLQFVVGVKFSGAALVTNFTGNDGTLTVVVPAGAVSGKITLVTPDRSVSTRKFTVVVAP